MSLPQRLQDIAGNQKLIGLFCRGQLPQSSLFVGPEGVGKRTTALLLAAQTNCKGRLGNDLCGECSSCVKARSGNHPDILLFQSDKLTISIESMRRLSREAQYRPFEGKLRFLVVDQAEKMSEEAANSILKTLEEPPETTRIVLVTSSPQRLLPTILSRCQVFPFQSLKQDEIVQYLRENTELSEVELRASFSEGSLGTAIDLDIEDTLTKRNLMLDILENWLKAPRFESVFRQCESSPLSGQLKKRDQVRHYLRLLQNLCYDVYFLLIGADERLVNRDCADVLMRISQKVSLEQIRDLLYHIAEAQRDVDRYVNPLICFETLWLGLVMDGKERC